MELACVVPTSCRFTLGKAVLNGVCVDDAGFSTGRDQNGTKSVTCFKKVFDPYNSGLQPFVRVCILISN